MQGKKKECEAGGQTYGKGIHRQECQSAVVRRKRDVPKSICRNKQDGLGESKLRLRKSWVAKRENPKRK